MDTTEMKEIFSFLREENDFLITSHINSDGDSVASSLAMLRLLSGLGKRARIILQDLPENPYDFLDGFEQIVACGASGGDNEPADNIIVLDCPSLDRIGSAKSYVTPGATVLNVDHHKDNKHFGRYNLLSQVSSTCEVIYELVVKSSITIDQPLAEQLYTGILYDSGGFRYSLATSTTLEVAAALVRCGARLDIVADRIYNCNNLDTVKLVGRAIESLELACDGRVALLHLDHKDMKQGDPGEAVGYGLKIRGVEVTLLLKEEEPEHYRVSLRSRSEVDVSIVAAAFGGGGHARASGCRLDGKATDVRQALLAEVEKLLP